jgi:HAD superfamily hydrolase (TIGR01509 family)
MRRTIPDADRDALLLDLGGVLVGVDPSRTFRAFAQRSGADADRLAATAALAAELKERAFDLGRMNANEFRVDLGAALACEIEQPEFDLLWSAMVTPLPAAPALIDELAEHHALYLLSNTDPIHFAAADRLLGGRLERLDGLHLSYEVGRAKPAAEYFTAALDAFELAAERCTLLDDRPENLAGARAVGIAGRLVGSSGLTRTALVEWGLLPGNA